MNKLIFSDWQPNIKWLFEIEILKKYFQGFIVADPGWDWLDPEKPGQDPLSLLGHFLLLYLLLRGGGGSKWSLYF